LAIVLQLCLVEGGLGDADPAAGGGGPGAGGAGPGPETRPTWDNKVQLWTAPRVPAMQRVLSYSGERTRTAQFGQQCWQ
jgi:hypothetical protein